MSDVYEGRIIPEHTDVKDRNHREIQKIYCNNASCDNVRCRECLFNCGSLDKFKEWYDDK